MKTKAENIVSYTEEHPEKTYAEIAKMFNVSRQYVHQTLKRAGYVKEKRTFIKSKRKEEILSRFGKLCFYCGLDAETIDHIVPIVRGGGNEDSNLVACCAMCNQYKWANTFEDFLDKTLKDYHHHSEELKRTNNIINKFKYLSPSYIHKIVDMYYVNEYDVNISD